MNICNICQKNPTSGKYANICSSRWVCLYVLIPSVSSLPEYCFRKFYGVISYIGQKLLAKIMQRLYCSEASLLLRCDPKLYALSMIVLS